MSNDINGLAEKMKKGKEGKIANCNKIIAIYCILQLKVEITGGLNILKFILFNFPPKCAFVYAQFPGGF